MNTLRNWHTAPGIALKKSVVVWRACIYENAHKYFNGANIFDSHVALISLLDSIHHFVFMLHIMISGEWSSSAEEAGCVGIDYCWLQANLFRAYHSFCFIRLHFIWLGSRLPYSSSVKLHSAQYLWVALFMMHWCIAVIENASVSLICIMLGL